MELVNPKGIISEIKYEFCDFCQERCCDRTSCDVYSILDIISNIDTIKVHKCKDCPESCTYEHTQNDKTETLRFCTYIEHNVEDNGWCIKYDR